MEEVKIRNSILFVFRTVQMSREGEESDLEDRVRRWGVWLNEEMVNFGIE